MMIETIERILENLEEGNIGFAEAGDWLHNMGDEIVSELEEKKDLEDEVRGLDAEERLLRSKIDHLEGRVEDLEDELAEAESDRDSAYDEGHDDGYSEAESDMEHELEMAREEGYQEGYENGLEEGADE